MFHIVLAIASRFLYFGNTLQGFARGILALRNLGAITSHLIPAISPPPPIALLDAPVPFVSLPEEIIPPYPSGGLIALERIGRQPPPFASPVSIPSYQSSLITVSSGKLPIFLPLFIIMLAIISGFVIVLPEIIDFFMNIAKSRYISDSKERILDLTNFELVTSKVFPHMAPVGHLLLWAIGPIITILQWCGLLAVKDTRTPPIVNAIYEQISRSAAGYEDLVDYSDTNSIFYPDFAHDEIPEAYRLRLQSIYLQFVETQDLFREELKNSRSRQLELQADLHAAEHERKRLVSRRQAAKDRCAEAEATLSKVRADLTAAVDRLDRETDLTRSVTEKSQVAHVRLKYAENKITKLNAKLQHERDRRHRKTKELLDEQARIQDGLESEIHRLKQEAQDAQEQLDSLRATMSDLDAERRSPFDDDDRYQPPLPPEHSHYTGTPLTSPTKSSPSKPTQDHWVALHNLFARMREEDDAEAPSISPTTIVNPSPSPYTPSQDQEGSSTHQGPTSKVARDHWVALEELFGRMRQEDSEYESAQEVVKPNSEQQESRLQDELALTKEQLRLAEEEFSRDQEELRAALWETKSHVAYLRNEWDMSKEALQEARDARCSSLADLTEVMDLLRMSQAEWEESQFRNYQVNFLCAALQERVTELEAEGKRLKKCQARTPVHTDPESSCCLTGTAPPDVEAITYEHEVKLQDSDSIYMTIPPLLPRLLDLPLPFPSSPFNSSSSLYLDDQGYPVMSPTPSDIDCHLLYPTDTDVHSIPSDTDSFMHELSLALRSCDEIELGNEQGAQQSTELVLSSVDPGSANPESTNLGRLPPSSSPSSELVSRLLSPIYRTFLSERNSLVSMAWPPIESALFPGSGNVRQDREEGRIETEEGTDGPIPFHQDTLFTLQESEPVVLERRDTKTTTSPRSTFPIRLPHHSLRPPNNILTPLQNSVAIDYDGAIQLRRRNSTHRRGFSRIPVPKLDYDLPADFVPGITRTPLKRQATVTDDEFAYFIPLDCPTSTPAAARRRMTLKE